MRTAEYVHTSPWKIPVDLNPIWVRYYVFLFFLTVQKAELNRWTSQISLHKLLLFLTLPPADGMGNEHCFVFLYVDASAAEDGDKMWHCLHFVLLVTATTAREA